MLDSEPFSGSDAKINDFMQRTGRLYGIETILNSSFRARIGFCNQKAYEDSYFKVYALDGKTGIKKWEFETGNEVSSSPAIGVDGTVYVGSADKMV